MKNLSLFGLTLSLVACLSLFFTACSKDHFDTSSDESSILSAEELADISANFCSTADPSDDNDPASTDEPGVEDRATGLKGKFWSPGATIRVRFMNGTSSLQSKVFNYFKQWSNYANVNIVKVTSGSSEVRVKFGTQGHNSLVGRDNLNASQSSQTMNLQLTDNSSETDVRRAALHEFGHVMGLAHEHQNPLVNIPWDKPKVYAYYASTQGWSKAQVDQNVLNNLGWGPAQHTDFDAASVMAYPVPASLTTNGYSIPWNTQLSSRDKEFIGKMYSTVQIRVRHAANVSGTISFYLNGIYTTVSKNEAIYVPAKTSGNVLQVWECPSGCQWSSFNVTQGKKYKIVSTTSNATDFMLVQE